MTLKKKSFWQGFLSLTKMEFQGLSHLKQLKKPDNNIWNTDFTSGNKREWLLRDKEDIVNPVVAPVYCLWSVSRLQCKEGQPRQSIMDSLIGEETVKRPRQLMFAGKMQERRELNREKKMIPNGIINLYRNKRHCNW